MRIGLLFIITFSLAWLLGAWAMDVGNLFVEVEHLSEQPVKTPLEYAIGGLVGLGLFCGFFFSFYANGGDYFGELMAISVLFNVLAIIQFFLAPICVFEAKGFWITVLIIMMIPGLWEAWKQR